MDNNQVISHPEAKNYALIKDGVVVNVVFAHEEFVSTHLKEYTAVDLTGLDPRPGIGWHYKDSKFMDPNSYSSVLKSENDAKLGVPTSPEKPKVKTRKPKTKA